MVDRSQRRLSTPLSDAARRRYIETQSRIDGIRQQVEADLPEMLSAARRARAAHDQLLLPSRQALNSLRAERVAQSIGFAEMESRSGIPASDLCRLEEDETATCSLAILHLYAAALGKRISIMISDPG